MEGAQLGAAAVVGTTGRGAPRHIRRARALDKALVVVHKAFSRLKTHHGNGHLARTPHCPLLHSSVRPSRSSHPLCGGSMSSWTCRGGTQKLAELPAMSALRGIEEGFAPPKKRSPATSPHILTRCGKCRETLLFGGQSAKQQAQTQDDGTIGPPCHPNDGKGSPSFRSPPQPKRKRWKYIHHR